MPHVSRFACIALLFVATVLPATPALAVQPAAETLISIRGGGLERMQQFGAPELVIAKRGKESDNDDVLFNYGPFILRVHHDTITNCFFLNTWKGSIRGIRIGDSREDVVNALGKPRIIYSKAGVETDYGYVLKDSNAMLYANFNDDGNVKRVEIDRIR